MNKYLRFFLFSLIFTGAVVSSSIAQENSQEKTDRNEKPADEGQYEYKSAGRTDPFKPFLTPKAVTATDPNEIVEEKTEYSGMQLFEPGQLALVGIMATSHGPVAMVQDQTKKGYMLRIGDLIGKRGVVTSIEAQRVEITETARTRVGNEIKNKTTMKIQHEGDK